MRETIEKRSCDLCGIELQLKQHHTMTVCLYGNWTGRIQLQEEKKIIVDICVECETKPCVDLIRYVQSWPENQIKTIT